MGPVRQFDKCISYCKHINLQNPGISHYYGTGGQILTWE